VRYDERFLDEVKSGLRQRRQLDQFETVRVAG